MLSGLILVPVLFAFFGLSEDDTEQLFGKSGETPPPAHERCLKARDYKGCMEYQRRQVED